jgi:hypothetical protein
MSIAPYGQYQITHIKIEFGRNKRITLQTYCASTFQPDIVPSDFFLFGWLKNELVSWLIAKIDEPFQIAREIMGTLTIETIISVFPTGSKDWNKLLIPMLTTSDTDSNKGKSITPTKFLLG